MFTESAGYNFKTKIMKRSFGIILLLLTYSFMFSQEKTKGEREVVSVTKNLDQNFKTLDVTDNISVILNSGKANSYTLTADQNLQEIVELSL